MLVESNPETILVVWGWMQSLLPIWFPSVFPGVISFIQSKLELTAVRLLRRFPFEDSYLVWCFHFCFSFGLVDYYLEIETKAINRSFVDLAFPCGCATHRLRPVERTKREGLPPPHFTHCPHCSLICPLITAW